MLLFLYFCELFTNHSFNTALSYMKADIITIGDELLIGQVINTNSTYLASELNRIGFSVNRIISIGDVEESISAALEDSIQNADFVILTGGLGPTSDDITKNTLNHFFKGKYVIHEFTLQLITRFFAARGWELTDRNRKQAEIPDTCEPLINRIGTAPGMLFKRDNKLIVSLPGVPFEMKDLFEKEVIPRLLKHYNLSVHLHKTILTVGLSESDVADRLAKFESELDNNLSLAYLPSPGVLRLRLSIFGTDHDRLAKILNDKCNEIVAVTGANSVFGYDDDTLPGVIGEVMRRNNFRLSVAESCTGGNIAHLITSVPGSSDYFNGGVVAYSNEVKQNILGVQQNVLKQHGAVSEEVVTQMASGVKKSLKTGFSIATSGIAGPGGGTPQKPVGTIWIAIATPDKVISQKFLFGNDRKRNIVRSSFIALNMLRTALLEYIKNSE